MQAHEPDAPASALRVISPAAFDAVIFDLDGVVTDTAGLHAQAWKAMFDEFLRRRSDAGRPQRPFDPDGDYRAYLDGVPRYDGVQRFLASRGIELPYGNPADEPGRETVCGLGNRKNDLFLLRLRKKGADVFGGTVRLIRDLRAHRVRTAVVSSSRNCRAILESSGLAGLFDARVDGEEAGRLNLPGKPDPAYFLEAARRVEAPPERAAVVEDALSGVEAGRRGGFGRVIGVDRSGHPEALRDAGAHVVVADLAEVRVGEAPAPAAAGTALPSALERLEEIVGRAGPGGPAVFLDYDGTLTPIVERPEDAVLAPAMRDAVERLGRRCPVAVVSGRDLGDVQRLVGLDDVYYAGSHGFDIAGPRGRHIAYQHGTDFLPDLDEAEAALRRAVEPIAGAQVERKRFSIAVHFRRVAPAEAPGVERAVDGVLAAAPSLRKGHGKMVFELRPDIDWDKGRAVRWLLEALGLAPGAVLPLYLGDDVTDEDAFRALRDDGIGILVGPGPAGTAAHYALADPGEVRRFLEALVQRIEERG